MRHPFVMRDPGTTLRSAAVGDASAVPHQGATRHTPGLEGGGYPPRWSLALPVRPASLHRCASRTASASRAACALDEGEVVVMKVAAFGVRGSDQMSRSGSQGRPTQALWWGATCMPSRMRPRRTQTRVRPSTTCSPLSDGFRRRRSIRRVGRSHVPCFPPAGRLLGGGTLTQYTGSRRTPRCSRRRRRRSASRGSPRPEPSQAAR